MKSVPGPVGMAVTHHPPDRPVLALLTHTVPTLEEGMPRPISNLHTLPQHYSAPAFSGSVSSTGPCLGSSLADRLPSMPSAVRSPVFVRALRRYYAVARLPAAVHPGLIAHRLLPAVRVLLTTGDNGASRFSRVKFLCVPGVFDSAGPRRTRFIARRPIAFRLG